VQIQNLVKLGNVAIWARVFHNAAQSIANNATAALAFNSERNDTDTIHDTVTNNSRLICKTAGIYQITGQATFAANATGIREVGIRLNGSTFLADSNKNNVGASIDARLSVTTIYNLAVNDYVELIVFQNSGASLNVLSAGNYSPEFMMIRIGG
jgi:hypothetical protein